MTDLGRAVVSQIGSGKSSLRQVSHRGGRWERQAELGKFTLVKKAGAGGDCGAPRRYPLLLPLFWEVTYTY